jgi:hypothetical protein
MWLRLILPLDRLKTVAYHGRRRATTLRIAIARGIHDSKQLDNPSRHPVSHRNRPPRLTRLDILPSLLWVAPSGHVTYKYLPPSKEDRESGAKTDLGGTAGSYH